MNHATKVEPPVSQRYRAFSPDGARELVVYAHTVDEANEKLRASKLPYDPATIELCPRPEFAPEGVVDERRAPGA